MSEGPIVVIDYGMGNIHSMIKALRLYDDHVIFSKDSNDLKNAKALVLPGDGAFSAAMENLSGDTGKILVDHVKQGRPLLGVCIGFQILFDDSSELDLLHGEEGATVKSDASGVKVIPGLGLIPGKIRRFRPAGSERVPHMGWNNLEASDETNGHYMYFIHSYRAEQVPENYVLAEADYANDRFPAIVKKGSLLATQFHPEKSDKHGLEMIHRWVRSVQEGTA